MPQRSRQSRQLEVDLDAYSLSFLIANLCFISLIEKTFVIFENFELLLRN
jgi:hypothetical protein